jgi:cation:H+ antiporter
MILYLILCILCLFLLTKGVQWAIKYSSRLAGQFHLSEFIISFFIVAVISVFPEATISIISAFEGIPEFGLGTLMGSNVTDLLLVFGIIAIFSPKGIKIKSEIVQNSILFAALVALPVLLGYDGKYSRLDGLLLLLGGLAFYLTLSIESRMIKSTIKNANHADTLKNIILLALSMALVIASAYFTIHFGVEFANRMMIPAVLVSLTLIAVGTCLPELMFSLKSVQARHDELALGDLFGTIVTDATIILGIVILIQPFSFNPAIVYLTGTVMCLAALLLAVFIRKDKVLSKKEGIILLLCYIVYLTAEILLSKAAA